MEFNKDTFAINCLEILHKLHQFYLDVCENDSIMIAFSSHATAGVDAKSMLAYMVYADAITCIENSGHSSVGYDKESIPVKLIFYKFLGYEGKMTIGQFFDNVALIEKTIKLAQHVKSMSLFKDLSHGSFNVCNVLSDYQHNYEAAKYAEIMLELSKCVSYADNSISETEKSWVKLLKATLRTYQVKAIGEASEILEILHNVKSTNNSGTSTSEQNITEDKDDALTGSDKAPIEQLNELIGLNTVKNDVRNLSNLLKMQRVRESRGLKATPVSYHCVFTGNPGTGKTTVARILANIYKDLGVIQKGHLVETDRSGLVAEYVGQTAVKTNEIIDRAIGGVLFIDEAYSLVQGGQNDFGKEAISTLLKRMEDERGRLVVILAGYSVEMDEFINSNSGLQSRFSRYIDFPDYNEQELLSIFDHQLKINQYVISESARQKVFDIICDKYSKKDKNFGNARFVRTLFEKIITHQANRLATVEQLTDDMLMEIIDEDVYLNNDTEFVQHTKKIGFKN